MFTACNLQRVINIVGIKVLMEYFQGFFAQLSAKITAQNFYESLKAKFRRMEIFLANIFEKNRISGIRPTNPVLTNC
jgi:hypothetical protein